MIKYNFAYRGPYEYDKFVLNYLQLHNAILFLEDETINEQLEEKKSLKKCQKELEDSLKDSEDLVNKVYKMYLPGRL